MSDPAGQVRAIARATARERLLASAKRGMIMQDPGTQLDALVDLAKALDDAGVDYALIGGIAVGIHSNIPRATLDIDIAVPTSVAPADLTNVLTARGFEHRGDFPHSINFRHSSGEPVQVAFDPFFDQMIARAETFQIAEGSIKLVRKDDLIAMKRRASQDPSQRKSKAFRDQADIELLTGDVPDEDEGW